MGKVWNYVKDFIDIRISAKEGFNVQMFNNKFIILDTSLDQDLLDEGCAREFVSRIQQLRKSNGYEVMDRIDISYSSDEAMDRAIAIYTISLKPKRWRMRSRLKPVQEKFLI